MKNLIKFFSLLLIFYSLFLIPDSVYAGLSETCFPSVVCPTGQDYYKDDCRTHIEAYKVAEAGGQASCESVIPGGLPGDNYQFTCEDGCRKTAKYVAPLSCGAGHIWIDSNANKTVEAATECFVLANVIYDHVTNMMLKIWDGSAFSRFVYLADNACGANQTVKWNGTAWICANDNDTTYSAGSGLSLTGTTFANTAPNATHTGDVTGSGILTIGINTVTSAHIFDGTIKAVDIADSAVVTGRIADAAVTTGKISTSGATVAGQVLKYNGTGVVWGTDLDTDTNTTYSAGTGLTLTGTTFSHTAHTGDVTGADILTIGNDKVTSAKIAAGAVTKGKLSAASGTNGQVLSTDGTNLTWITPNVLPAGASGQTLRHDGASWTANSNLYNNGTNVGIGTVSPATTLHVATGVDASLLTHGYAVLGSVSGANIVIDNNEIIARNNGAASPLYLQAEGSFLQIGDTTNNTVPGGAGTGLRLGASSTSRWIQTYDSKPLSLNPIGNNVGIGTEGPTTKLDVDGGMRVRGLLSCDTVKTDASGNLSCGIGGSSLWTASGSDVYRVGGKVGIGTTSPQELLHIYGDFGHAGIRILGGYTGGNEYIQFGGSDSIFIAHKGYQIGRNSSDNFVITRSNQIGTVVVPDLLTITSSGALTLPYYTTCGALTTDASGKVNCGSASSSSWKQKIESEQIDSGATPWKNVNKTYVDTGYNWVTIGQTDPLTALAGARLGIGTTTPVTALQVINNGTNALWKQANLTSSGYGYMVLGEMNSVNMAFDTDSIMARNNNSAAILRLQEEGGNLLIGKGGTTLSVGINTSIPSFNLHVEGSAGKTGGGSWSTVSDIRLKNINGEYKKGLSEILQLTPVNFNYKKDNRRGLPSDQTFIGFVAQEAQKVFPETVTKAADGYLDFNMHAVNVAVVNAVKELSAENDKLKAELSALKARVEALEKK